MCIAVQIIPYSKNSELLTFKRFHKKNRILKNIVVCQESGASSKNHLDRHWFLANYTTKRQVQDHLACNNIFIEEKLVSRSLKIYLLSVNVQRTNFYADIVQKRFILLIWWNNSKTVFFLKVNLKPTKHGHVKCR